MEERLFGCNCSKQILVKNKILQQGAFVLFSSCHLRQIFVHCLMSILMTRKKVDFIKLTSKSWLVSKCVVNLWDMKFNLVLRRFRSRCKVINLSICHLKFQITFIQNLVKLNYSYLSTWNFHQLLFPTRGNYRRHILTNDLIIQSDLLKSKICFLQIWHAIVPQHLLFM